VVIQRGAANRKKAVTLDKWTEGKGNESLGNRKRGKLLRGHLISKFGSGIYPQKEEKEKRGGGKR